MLPEIKLTLDRLRERDYKLSTGSSSKNTPFILERLELSDYFDAVSDGNNITRSKPDPEVFLKAAEHLGLPPEKCVVIGDAVTGAQAGHADGFKVAYVGDASRAGGGGLRGVPLCRSRRPTHVNGPVMLFHAISSNHVVEDQNSHTGFAMPEFPGCNGPASHECWLLKVKAVTHRHDPIMQTCMKSAIAR